MMKPAQITVIGGGSWGCALASLFASQFPKGKVRLWLRDLSVANSINENHQNPKYLPNIPLSDKLLAIMDPKAALKDANIILFILPLQQLRSGIIPLLPFIEPDAIIINGAKGIEQSSLLLPHQILDKLCPNHPQMALVGPSFAKEVALGKPTALVLASHEKDRQERKIAFDALSCPTLRLYESDDLIGVELCAALKNVFAIAAGLTLGAGLGENARAALLARSLHELQKLVIKSGGKIETIYGLAGIGDLMLTANSNSSRNTKFGFDLAQNQGNNSEKSTLHEGVFTAEAALAMAMQAKVEMPIIEAVASVLKGDLSIEQAAKLLMQRPNPSNI